MKKIMHHPGWITVLILCICSALIYIFMTGCSFLALVVFGIAVILAGFLLLFGLRNRNKKLGSILLVCFACLVGIGFLAAVFTGILIGSAAKGDTETPCDYIIVLGAGVNGTVPSMSLQDRIDAAYDYLAANPGCIGILSGGQGPGEDISEAQCMADRLTAKGIDKERLWLEDRSTSTRENIAYSLALIEEKTGQRPQTAGILSSEYHLYRAGQVARGQGLAPVGIPAKTGWITLRLSYFLREIVAVWFYAVSG